MLSDIEIMAQVLAAFRAEQSEHRQTMGELLLELELDPAHPRRRELLDQLFREAHSLKGGARAAGMVAIEQVAHRVEDIFAAARRGDIDLTPAVCDPIYMAIDAIGVLMEQADAGTNSELVAPPALLDALSQALTLALSQVTLQETAPSPAELVFAEPTTSSSPAPLPTLPPANIGTPAVPSNATASHDDSTVRLSTTLLDGLLNEAGELMTSTLRARQLAREAAELRDLPARWRRTWRRISPTVMRLRDTAPRHQPVVHHLDEREGAETSLKPVPPPTVPLVEALDQANALIDAMSQAVDTLANLATEDHTRLSAITDRLHDQVRRARMLPLASLLSPLRLQLREMARSAGKSVTLELNDGGAEVDRQVLDELREVCLHMLRNAVVHGIESPEVRSAAGKPAMGTISLSATVNNDQLDIELADDGAGLNLAAIRQRALNTGLLSVADLSQTSDDQLGELIFLPGFSTSSVLSELSGRGVGLDVVRSQVERMHGQVHVHTRPGTGACFNLKIPLSLTSSHGLLLRAGNGTYAIPLNAVRRITTATPHDMQYLEGQPVLFSDGRLLPLVALSDMLNAESVSRQQARQLALILGIGDRQIACLIDVALGEQELVVYRLPPPLLHVRFIAGATILADGQVVPILDAVDLIRAAAGERRIPTLEPTPIAEQRTPTILVADDSITTRTLEKNILEAAGYKVALATDGLEAMETLRQLTNNGGCDLLLSDIDMPRLNGFDLTAQVRADTHLRHLPVVLVTSLDSPGDRQRGVDAGADAYIVKRSFDQQSLLETIARLI